MPKSGSLFESLVDRLNYKTGNDKNRNEDNKCRDNVDDRMLLDEHSRKHDQDAENIACNEKDLLILECEMKACCNCKGIVNMKARQYVSGRVDRMQI